MILLVAHLEEVLEESDEADVCEFHTELLAELAASSFLTGLTKVDPAPEWPVVLGTVIWIDELCEEEPVFLLHEAERGCADNSRDSHWPDYVLPGVVASQSLQGSTLKAIDARASNTEAQVFVQAIRLNTGSTRSKINRPRSFVFRETDCFEDERAADSSSTRVGIYDHVFPKFGFRSRD